MVREKFDASSLSFTVEVLWTDKEDRSREGSDTARMNIGSLKSRLESIPNQKESVKFNFSVSCGAGRSICESGGNFISKLLFRFDQEKVL